LGNIGRVKGFGFSIHRTSAVAAGAFVHFLQYESVCAVQVLRYCPIGHSQSEHTRQLRPVSR